MTSERSGRLTRRTVLGATGALALGGTALGTSSASSHDGVVLEQGSDCVPITPISGSESPQALYDWRVGETDYSSAGTRDLQRGDTSILFLYEDPAGEYYLVIVHDRYDLDDQGSQYDGGSATFTFEGLTGGSWVVRDDFYDAPSSYDRWNVSGEPQVVDWTWGDARTDGGVYGPLGTEFDVTIDPAFNEAAGLAGEYYDGRITDWQVLSGARSTPDRTSLSLEKPITIRTGECEPSSPPAPGQLDVRIPQGRLNPRSRGLLAVDLHSTRSHPVADIAAGSIRTVPNGVTPSEIELRPGRRDVVRLLFPVPELDLSGGSTATLRIEAETTDGRPGTGRATVELVPRPGRDDEGSEGDDEDDGTDDDDDEVSEGDDERTDDGGDESDGPEGNDGEGEERAGDDENGAEEGGPPSEPPGNGADESPTGPPGNDDESGGGDDGPPSGPPGEGDGEPGPPGGAPGGPGGR